jgi:hypothetical protein
MTTDTVVLHLPDDIYRRIAHLSSLPPLPDDFAPEIHEALQRLEQLSDSDLTAFERATLATDDYARLTELRERRREGAISPDEQTELDHLMQAGDTLTLQKAYAAALLKWRGQARTPRSDA